MCHTRLEPGDPAPPRLDLVRRKQPQGSGTKIKDVRLNVGRKAVVKVLKRPSCTTWNIVQRTRSKYYGVTSGRTLDCYHFCPRAQFWYFLARVMIHADSDQDVLWHTCRNILQGSTNHSKTKECTTARPTALTHTHTHRHSDCQRTESYINHILSVCITIFSVSNCLVSPQFYCEYLLFNVCALPCLSYRFRPQRPL